MVGFDGRVNVILVYPYRNSHQHVLRPFDDISTELQEVRPLQSFETKVVVIKISVVNYLAVQARGILESGEAKSEAA